MSPVALALATVSSLVLLLVVLLVRRRRKKKKATTFSAHRRTTIYDASLREKAATAEAKDECNLARREASALRANVKMLQRAQLELTSENARLHRDLNGRWEQIEELSRELASLRDA